MKKTLLTMMVLVLGVAVGQAQVRTGKLMQYNSFRPSTITLASGRVLNQSLTNIFLKNSSLVYMSGGQVMQANLDQVASVSFGDRLYVKVDTLLAYQVDTVGTDGLFKATVIDLVAYRQQLRNNQQISSLDLGEQISYSTLDISTEEDHLFPLIDLYFFWYKGKFYRVHDLQRSLPKDKQRILKTQLKLDDFSWQSEASLMRLLRSLQ